jgi:hypothetical protein
MDGTEEGLLPLPESQLVDAVVEPVVRQATDAFLAELDKVTVDELCRRAETKLKQAVSATPDFTI